MKIQRKRAEREGKLLLCNGSREREIPIRTPARRTALEHTKRLADDGSLIRAQKSYNIHLMSSKKQTARSSISRIHGLRHAYAQCDLSAGVRYANFNS